jgi:hypothetical protein
MALNTPEGTGRGGIINAVTPMMMHAKPKAVKAVFNKMNHENKVRGIPKATKDAPSRP